MAAFSGGPDSCALLLGLRELGRIRGIEVVAAHLDHGLDPDSAARRRRAAYLAEQLAVPFLWARRDVAAARERRATLEETARRVRYEYLEEVRNEVGGRWIATAHHRDDQLETLLLRLLQGTGPLGLAGIRPRAGSVVRPLLELSRAELRNAAASGGLEPIEDPTNFRLDAARNRLRLLVLPRLLEEEPNLAERAGDLAAAARGAGEAIDRALRGRLAIEPHSAASSRLTVPLSALRELPEPLLPLALALLHRRSGAQHPPTGAACRELGRQLAAGGRVGGDCGGGWRWRSCRGSLHLVPPEDHRAASRILCDSGAGSPTCRPSDT
ncbi:MAG TPA: tRNA lysidine(34) synthetase TilS [Thermoanaerobaculia bacterium]|nr:tRNA lysidine(34) synthetase TilS [Thermoanaerobaculia bacterium]